MIDPTMVGIAAGAFLAGYLADRFAVSLSVANAARKLNSLQTALEQQPVAAEPETVAAAVLLDKDAFMGIAPQPRVKRKYTRRAKAPAEGSGGGGTSKPAAKPITEAFRKRFKRPIVARRNMSIGQKARWARVRAQREANGQGKGRLQEGRMIAQDLQQHA